MKFWLDKEKKKEPETLTWNFSQNQDMPDKMYVEGIESSAEIRDVEVRLAYEGIGECEDKALVTVGIPRVLSPHGDPAILPEEGDPAHCEDYSLSCQHYHNTGVWHLNALALDIFLAEPGLSFNWKISDLPAKPDTDVSWKPFDPNGVKDDEGLGTKPKLTVKYKNNKRFKDFMPPDNTWFGDKTVSVKHENFSVDRKIRIFFMTNTLRPSADKKQTDEPAWYYYWKMGAVPKLILFEYDPKGDAPSHTWNKYQGDRYFINRDAYLIIRQSVFDVTPPGTYTEKVYPNGKGTGIHSVAKYCEHELWHGILEKEVRPVKQGGLGYSDRDGDGLSNDREREIGTDVNKKDTCNLSAYKSGGTSYKDYKDYADQELFCRWKQDGVLGVESKDWSNTGKQSYAGDR